MDAWSMGLRDGDRWVWRRDDAMSKVIFYDEDGNVDHSRPYTAMERELAASRRAREGVQEARKGALEQLDGLTRRAAPASLPALAERVLVLESIVAALVGEPSV